jgi:hypothetical protein
MSMIVKIDDMFSTSHYRVHPWDVKNNPYLMLWTRVYSEPEALAKELGLKLRDTGMLSISARWEAISRYGFAIPDHAALSLIKKKSPNGVIEIGAGSGYWAKLLGALGVLVDAYDSYTGKYQHGFKHGSHATVNKLDHTKALSSEHAGLTLLLCWPDYQASWPAEALDFYKGDTVVYVGEGSDGCTGDSKFHGMLYENWTETDCLDIPQWFGIHDRVYIYKRGTNEEKTKESKESEV